MRGLWRSGLLGAVVACSGACTTIAHMPPRFIVVYDQQERTCRIQVVKDTRSRGCWVALTCGRHGPVIVTVDADVCVP